MSRSAWRHIAYGLVLASALGAAPRLVRTPKLTGLRSDPAQQTARLQGFTALIGRMYVSPENWRDDLEPDVVYLQTPQPDQFAAAGGEIACWTLRQAEADQPRAKTPDVRGLDLAAAVERLQAADLTALAGAGAAGRAIDQYPPAGRTAYAGTAVYLRLAPPADAAAEPPAE